MESGITPFRTYGPQKGGEKGSIWGTFDAGKMTSAGFNKDPECTKAWWRMKHSLYREFEGAKPNPAHDFFAKLDEALAAIRLYQPDVLILTLGFDIYKNDPQAKVSVTSEGFCRLSTHLRQLGLPTLVVQEGGYDLDALSENVQQFFKGLEG